LNKDRISVSDPEISPEIFVELGLAIVSRDVCRAGSGKARVAQRIRLGPGTFPNKEVSGAAAMAFRRFVMHGAAQ